MTAFPYVSRKILLPLLETGLCAIPVNAEPAAAVIQKAHNEGKEALRETVFEFNGDDVKAVLRTLAQRCGVFQ